MKLAFAFNSCCLIASHCTFYFPLNHLPKVLGFGIYFLYNQHPLHPSLNMLSCSMLRLLL